MLVLLLRDGTFRDGAIWNDSTVNHDWYAEEALSLPNTYSLSLKDR